MTKRGSVDKTDARTTVILPETLGENLELYCLTRRLGKGEVIRKALRKFLEEEGFKPDQHPEVTHRYEE